MTGGKLTEAQVVQPPEIHRRLDEMRLTRDRSVP